MNNSVNVKPRSAQPGYAVIAIRMSAPQPSVEASTSPAAPGCLLGQSFPLVLKKLIENPPKNFLDTGEVGEEI